MTTTTQTLEIRARSDVQKAREALSKPLDFGRVIADLMVTIHHDPDRGWHDAAVVPTRSLSLSPVAKVLHYGCELFEGHKAYRWPDGRVALFRPELNAARLNVSASRLGMPTLPVDLQLGATMALVGELREWVPRGEDASLYLRPTMIGTEAALGVGVSRTHLYFVVASPVGPYFPTSAGPIKVWVEPEDVRAVRGGVGFAKAGGNYAGGMAAQQRAKARGYDQVLFLDALEHRYLEEMHAMNVMLVEGDELVTPPLGGTILDGVTRRSILECAPDLGLVPRERPVDVRELVARIEEGRVSEMFTAGTAAVITPIGVLHVDGRDHRIGTGQAGPCHRRIYERLTGIQYGRHPDVYGWMRVVA
jgi:branched-chain amino acid aminotransferase